MSEAGVERTLGMLLSEVKNLREDLQRSDQKSDESRAVVHRRLDEAMAHISRLDTTVAISGQVDAQMRDEISDLRDVVEKSHAPAVADWRRIKMIGYGISGLIAFTGISVGVFASWASEAAVSTLRHWLRIP